ncbi:tyrosine-type recombinase/integrase [Herbaspirillum chlorophenolicum]|uniref:Tyrosine-type recombinase/integrase n=1 Tax=Herbaspirillum chlorophenolicum TaxID=211589 RepID=A0ABW8F163_9BURK
MGRIPTKNKHLPPRMRMRVQRSGKPYYYYDNGGKPRVETPLGSDYVVAVRKWAELEQDKSGRAQAVVTFKYVANRYKMEVLPGKGDRTQRDNLIEFTFLQEFFAEAPIDDIEPVHIRQYMDWRVKRSRELAEEKNAERVKRKLPPIKLTGKEGQVRANREKALFSHVFNMARNWGLTRAENPCAGIKGYTETGRDVYVEDDLFQKVYEIADQPTRDAMDLAYLTGQRPADTVGYLESDIKNGFLELQQDKTKKKLRIQIIGELDRVITRILARKRVACRELDVTPTELIVNEKGKRFSQSALSQRFYDARVATGIDLATFQFRDLRAKAGTDKAESAGDIRAAQKQLGHSSVTMTEAYTRQRKGDKVGPTR